jgi:hypothetical protein
MVTQHSKLPAGRKRNERPCMIHSPSISTSFDDLTEGASSGGLYRAAFSRKKQFYLLKSESSLSWFTWPSLAHRQTNIKVCGTTFTVASDAISSNFRAFISQLFHTRFRMQCGFNLIVICEI